MKRYLFFLILYGWTTFGICQNYSSYFTGNSQDALVVPKGGICLMGGASEHDNAMVWFLEQANGGDVLVLRASGSNGYNDYMYSQLGVVVNSVETIVCFNQNTGNESYIIDKINKAEAIWFAGGDQWDYISFWRNTGVNLALNEAIARGCVFGGTSAGMAILGGHYFTAENGTVSSSTALNNPYNSLVTVSNEPFLALPFLSNVITDTHYDNPDRRGRHTAFIAKQTQLQQQYTFGIACEEYVAVCIDTNGLARIFGEYPQYDEQAYFIQVNCEISNNYPEVCESGIPLTWNQGNQSLKVFKANGTLQGTATFDLTNWQQATGGVWEHWWVENGILNTFSGNAPTCLSTTNEIEIIPLLNPLQSNQWISWEEAKFLTNITSMDGQNIAFTTNENSFLLEAIPNGIYILNGIKNNHFFSIKIVLIN